MYDWVAIGLRFGLYLDLMLLSGLATHILHAPRSAVAVRRGDLAMLAGIGLVLSIAGFARMTATMAGLPILDLDRDILGFVVLDTAAGAAFLVRTTALIAVAMLGLLAPRRLLPWTIAVVAAIALATLAWTGHAAATEGWGGVVHRLADIVHLIAAAAWIGALAMLLKALFSPLRDASAIVDAHRALAGFAIAGSVLVALVVATGLVNGWMNVGPAGLPLLPDTLYGQLLLAKLGLFVAMLALAATNRWRLTPQLRAAAQTGNATGAIRALRVSITIEATAAIVILCLVAWLGTLAPSGV